MARKKAVAETEDIYTGEDLESSASTVELSEAEAEELREAGFDIYSDESVAAADQEESERAAVGRPAGEDADGGEAAVGIMAETPPLSGPPSDPAGLAGEIAGLRGLLADVRAALDRAERVARDWEAPAPPAKGKGKGKEKKRPAARVADRKDKRAPAPVAAKPGSKGTARHPLDPNSIRYRVWQHVKGGGQVDVDFVKLCRKQVFAGKPETFVRRRLENVVWRLKKEGYL